MSLDAVANFIKINVVGTYDAAATDITVETGKGATLPTPPFNMVWYNNTNFGDPSDDSFKEIIRVNSILGDVLTVTRGQEGIAASVKNIAGVQYKLLLAFTKKSYDEISTSTTIADTVSATTWPLLTESVTGTLSPKSDAGLTYNASTANLAATTFTGALVGNATTSTNTTGNAATVTVADAASDTTTYPLLGIDLTGNMSPRTDTGLTYNADTNVLTTTTFVGALTGASSLNVLKAGDTMSGVLTQNGLSLAGTAYQNQSFQNLLKNGDFESWSAGTAVAPDGWTLEGAGASVARNGTNFKIGTYGVAITYGSVEAGLYLSDRSVSSFYSGLLGKTLTMGAWVKTSTGSQARVYLDDGITASYSSYHTGGGTWEFLTVSHTIAGNAIIVNPRMLISVAGTAYFDGAILVEGSVVPAFAPRPLYDDGKTLTVDSANNLITTPKIAGGSATTQDLVLQTTTGVGEAGADMHFLVGNNGATEAVTILNSGNVGIGVASPRALLDVTSGTQNTIGDSPGIVTFTSAATIPSIGTLSLESNTEMDANIGSTLTFKARYIAANTQGAVFAAIKGIKESAVSGNLNGIMTFYVRTDGQDVNTASEKMRIVGSTGNVGIGTTAPATKLDVAGAIQVSSAVALSLGGYVRTFAEATGTPSGTTTYFDIAVDVPVGCKLLGAQLRVDTALTAGETWGAAYVTGSTTALAAAGTAVAQNTKISKMHVDEITTDTTKVRITRDAGNFTDAAGVIRAIVYFEQFTAMGNAA